MEMYKIQLFKMLVGFNHYGDCLFQIINDLAWGLKISNPNLFASNESGKNRR